jgi:hypothetical protein
MASRFRLFGSLMVAAVAAAAWSGCQEKTVQADFQAPPPPPPAERPQARTYDYSHKVLDNTHRPGGRKLAVAILRFGDTKEVDQVPWGDTNAGAVSQEGNVNVNVRVGDDVALRPGQTPPQMSKRAREILKSELVKSDAFTVIERERILEIIREINFGKTKYADPQTAPDEGQLLCVRYLLEGSLGLNEDMTLKDTFDKEPTYRDAANYQPGLWDNIFNRGKVNRDQMAVALRKAQEERNKNRTRQTYSVACYLTAYDVRTGEVATTVMGLGSNGLEAIADAVDELVSELSAKADTIRVAAISGDKVYLDVGSEGGAKAGNRYQVVHLGEPIRDRDGQVIGYQESEVGEIEISEAKPLMSVCTIVQKAGTIARGDLVKPAKH